jgi:hypothetical protein
MLKVCVANEFPVRILSASQRGHSQNPQYFQNITNNAYIPEFIKIDGLQKSLFMPLRSSL